MVFVPGQSGNPSGLRKQTENDRKAQYTARHYEPEAITKLVRLMRYGQPDAVKLGAIRELLDRARGRPPVAVLNAHLDLDGEDMRRLQDGLDDAERAAAAYAAMIGAKVVDDRPVIEAKALPAPPVTIEGHVSESWFEPPKSVRARRPRTRAKRPKTNVGK